jgi:hypothetical protein
MEDRLRGHFPSKNAVVRAVKLWAISAGELRVRHAGSFSSLAKVHSQWW